MNGILLGILSILLGFRKTAVIAELGTRSLIVRSGGSSELTGTYRPQKAKRQFQPQQNV